MPISIRRLARIVTRCFSPANSELSNLTPNGITEVTALGEHPVRVLEGSRGGQDQHTALTRTNGITDSEGTLKESGERGRRTNQATVTIDILPDDAFLEIFRFYLTGKPNTGTWRTLVHVCQRWRGLVFASPRHLDVRVVFTARTRVEEILAAWSTIPLLVLRLRDSGLELSRWEGADNIISALKHKTYVCQIELDGHSSLLLRRITGEMQESFPALTHLGIRSLLDSETDVAFPDDFLGGSAQSLRSCTLRSIAFPGIWKLLLTADRLVDLCLERVPSCTYISSEAVVNFLSELSHLEKFTLRFQHPRPRESIQFRPPETRVVLPTLTYIWVHSDCGYIEDLCSRIETPFLDWFRFTFFTVEYHTPQMHNFVSRINKFKGRRRPMEYMRGSFT